MTALERHVADYLAVRRGLGFKLANEQWMLADFAAFMEGVGASTVTVDLALRWATMPTGVGDAYLAQRMRAVRGFARYLHGIDPATEIPPLQLLPARRHRPAPHVYSDAEIAALMIAARALRPAMRAATMETLIGLPARPTRASTTAAWWTRRPSPPPAG
jgi:integrase/recombinase XerD